MKGGRSIFPVSRVYEQILSDEAGKDIIVMKERMEIIAKGLVTEGMEILQAVNNASN